MRTFYVVVATVAGALIGAAVTLSIVSAQKQVTRSTTFEWAGLEAKTTPIGARRDVMRLFKMRVTHGKANGVHRVARASPPAVRRILRRTSDVSL